MIEAIDSGTSTLTLLFYMVKKMFLGTVAFGFFVGGIYFALYLYNIYKLPR